MDCETNKTYNFCTTTQHTVNTKDFHIKEADSTWELKLEIFDKYRNPLEIVSLQRVDDKTWRWNEYTELKSKGEYHYSLCYIKNGKERVILKGMINVESYK